MVPKSIYNIVHISRNRNHLEMSFRLEKSMFWTIVLIHNLRLLISWREKNEKYLVQNILILEQFQAMNWLQNMN